MPKKDEFHDAMRNPLRHHSTKEIEKAIAKSLSELTGKFIDADIIKIDWSPENSRMNYKDAFISMHVTEETANLFSTVPED